MTDPRRAVVLMNLGGPDSIEAVEPFLRNLFSDPAIINLPGWLRIPLARLIARRRAATAREIYEYLGGASPLFANTQAQAQALEEELGPQYRCFVAMRYWRPFTNDAVAAVKAWDPDEVVLLPLYPQFSTTTTGSSFAEWHKEGERQGLARPGREIRSYPCAEGLIAALVESIEQAWPRDCENVRLLLSAHGLPMKIVRAGDPYPDEIRMTAEAVAQTLHRPGLDWRVCYQSRVGPLAWLGPSIDDELRQAANDRIGVIVVPLSFVSEHSETLVELDRDYRRMAETVGVPFYRRAAAVGTNPSFIATLAELVRGEPVESPNPAMLAAG